jgi:hypothetical protein
MKLLRNYLFWSYERGSFHYDVMVTMVLLFIFVSPHFINFRDRPVYNLPSQIMVQNDGAGGITYEVKQADVEQSMQKVGGSDPQLRTRRALRRLIEPIAGDVLVERYEPIRGLDGSITAYQVWAHR